MEKRKIKIGWFDILSIVAWLPLWIKQLFGVIESFPISAQNVLFIISNIALVLTGVAILYNGKTNKTIKVSFVLVRVVMALIWYAVMILTMISTSYTAITENPRYYSPTKFNREMQKALPEKIPRSAKNVEFYYYRQEFGNPSEEAILQYDLPQNEYMQEKEKIIQESGKEVGKSEFFDGYIEIDFYAEKYSPWGFTKYFVSFCDETRTIRFISAHDGSGIYYMHFTKLDREE